MRNKKLDNIVSQLENYIECWKQFNQFLAQARGRKFSPEDEVQFLEVKSVLIQELELILASLQVSSPGKEDIHALISGAPSLRFLAEANEGALRALENEWHKIYIGWHSILGQLKVRQRQEESKSTFAGLFRHRTA